jgi:hypothetical protein
LPLHGTQRCSSVRERASTPVHRARRKSRNAVFDEFGEIRRQA